MLFLPEAQQQIGPISISFGQSSAGWIEFAKILVAALSGLLVGSLLEYIKPGIAKWRNTKDIARQLNSDLMQNLSHIQNALKVLDDAAGKSEEHQKMALLIIKEMIGYVSNDRYQTYFEGPQKPLVYEIDSRGNLAYFYLVVFGASIRQAMHTGDLEDLRILLRIAERHGSNFVRHQRLNYKPTPAKMAVGADGKSIDISNE
jgi:hypothetical protein